VSGARGDAADNVVRLPVDRMTTATAPAAPAAWDVDDWGRDATVCRLAAWVLRRRWRLELGGLERLPAEGPGLVVVNSRQFMLTPWFAALSLSDALGRPVRFAGRPDTAPLGALARRLGGLLDRPDEVAGALCDGQLIVAGADGELDPRAVGVIDHRVIGAAVRARCDVWPATVTVSPIGRDARMEVGAPMRAPRRRRGPLAELELADALRQALRDQLDAGGSPRTGTPLDWIPLTGSGGGG